LGTRSVVVGLSTSTQPIIPQTKNLAVVQLYRKAAKYLQAAKIVFEVASNESRQAPALRLKKLYVLGALLIEQHHEQSRQKLARAKGEAQASASTMLEGLLLEDEYLSVEDTRLLDQAWRGAEAYHFFMLAHKQLYQRKRCQMTIFLILVP